MPMSCEDVAVIAALKAKIAALKLAIAEILKERSLRVLKTDPFVFVDQTASEPRCAFKTHNKSKLESTVVALEAFPDEVWDAPYIRAVEKKEVTVDSEVMIVARVVEIMQALIVGLGLKDLVDVATKRVLAGVELDIVLLFGSERIPFATIEVKECDNIFKGEHDFSRKLPNAGYTTGQHLDQLNAIGLFGFQPVFGMITNGNKWMLTSTTNLTGSQVSIETLSTATPDVPIAFAVTEEEVAAGIAAEEITVEKDGSAGEDERNAGDADERVLYTSQVVGLKEVNGEVDWGGRVSCS
jgi:hypothetical protein